MKSKIIYTLIVIFMCFAYQAKSETLLSPGDSTLTYVGCFGDGYSQIVNGTLYDENLPTGLETITGGSYTGADSLVTIYFIFNSPSTGTEYYTGCIGDGYSTIVSGTIYNESNPNGTETIIGGSYLGCDSIITVDLVFNPTSTGTESYVGCMGDGYQVTVNGTVYAPLNPTGTEVLTNYLNCDSIVNVNLIFNSSSTGTESYIGQVGDGYATTVNGTLYDELNPTGTEVMTNYLGCDSTVTINLVYNPAALNLIEYVGCPGDGYSTVVNGTTYDESNPTGVETIIGGSYLGTDSVITVTLVFNSSGTEYYTGCIGDGYSTIVSGTIYNESNPNGTETIIGGSYLGCDSIITVDLVFNPTSTGTESYVGCIGDGYSVAVNGTIYNEVNPTGTEVLVNYLGCDSIVTINLVHNPHSTGTESYIGQVGDGYSTTVNGTVYDELNPTGTEVLTNYLGCDSTVTINLVYNPVASNLIEYVGCPGDGYSTVVNGTTYDESNPTGVETIIGGSYLGTDSVITVTLVFNSSGTEYYTGCIGDGYATNVNGTIYDESNPTGTETIVGGSYLGCDSIVTVDLVFNPTSTGTETWLGCIGDMYDITVNGTYYGESNPTGTEILTNYLNCDSVVTINLVYNTNSPSTESYTGCSGDGYSVVVNGTTYDEGNPTGYEYLTTYQGCDSSITVNLTFLPFTTFDYNETQCPGSGFSYTVGSDTYDETNPTGTTIISNQFGCDSIVNVNLSFTGLGIDISPSNPTLDCNGSGVSIISIPNNGQAPYTYAWSDGSTNISPIINTIGTYTVTITDTNGCSGTESVIVADSNPIIPNYTVNNVSCNGLNDGSINMGASGGTPPHIYDWSNGLISGLASNLSANVYTVTITDDVGCTTEETVIVTEPDLLTININVDQEPTCNNTDGIITAVVNGGTGAYSYLWSNGTTSASINNISHGTYFVTLTDANLCSEINSIYIPSVNALGNESYTGCEGDGYSITLNGNIYDETNPTGTEVLIGAAADGCDSTVTVELEFLATTYGSENYTGVEGDGYNVSVNGIIYDENNPTGTETLTNFNGCDSIVSIQLNFYPTSTNFIDYNGCPGDGYSVTANGVIYDESNPSGTETISGGSYLGTDSVIVVNLVFAPSFTLNINAVPLDISCEVQESVLTANTTNGTAPFSYLWNGPLFQTTQSIIVDAGGTYTVTVTDNSGCSNTSEVVITENTTDSCVFPGDANYDFVVNSMDHLTVCLAGGDTGIARNTQGISFVPHLAQDWNQQALAGVDNKHLDCDGDGTIQAADLSAVNQNYNSMHDGVNPLRTDGAPSVRLVFDEHFDINAQNNTIVGTIVLDNPETQGDIIDLYGILFSINYDNTIIEDNSIVINYLDNSWIGTSAEVATLYKDFPTSSQMDLAFTRGDQVSVSGSGVIAEIQFVIEDNLIGMTSDHTLPLEVTNVYAHNNLAAPIAFNAEGDVIDISIVSANHNLLSEDLINVFPNPTKNHLTIDINDLTGVSYLLYNALGQQVSNGNITSDITTINTSKLSTGIYFLNVQTEEGMINVKVLVE